VFGAPRRPAGGASALPQPLAAIGRGVLLLKGREGNGRGGEGTASSLFNF